MEHLSCWLFIINEPEFASNLIPLTTEDALPMQLRLRLQEEEKVVNLYSNVKVQDLLKLLAVESGIEESELRVKMVEDTRITRIDTQVFDKETIHMPVEHRRLNSLKDVKVAHNSAFLVERKDPDEMVAEEVSETDGGAKKYVSDVVDLDDTEDFRTVIVNTEDSKDEFNRFQLNLNWTLAQLVKYL